MTGLSAVTLRALLNYEPETGAFTWRIDRHKVRAGSVAGCYHIEGYRLIKVLQRSYRAHRLAWLHVYGEWPAGQIDHRDGDPANNSIKNLRVVTGSINCQNRRLIGGAYQRGGKWHARIAVNGQRFALGVFAAQAEAGAAYANAKQRLHPGFVRGAQ